MLLPQFRDFERPQDGSDRDGQRIKSHELLVVRVEFLFDSYLGLLHPPVLLLAFQVDIPLAGKTLNQFLALPLIRTSVKLRIVGVTKAVNWGLPGELVVIEDARVIFRVVDDINCEILVHITDDRGV